MIKPEESTLARFTALLKEKHSDQFARIVLEVESDVLHRDQRPKRKDVTPSGRAHQRYRVLDQVRRGFTLLAAAERVGGHFTVAYDWVHRFNESGFGTFEQVPNPIGRPPILRASQLRELIEVARSSPSETGNTVFRLVGLQAGRVLSSPKIAAGGDRRVGPLAPAPCRADSPARHRAS